MIPLLHITHRGDLSPSWLNDSTASHNT